MKDACLALFVTVSVAVVAAWVAHRLWGGHR